MGLQDGGGRVIRGLRNASSIAISAIVDDLERADPFDRYTGDLADFSEETSGPLEGDKSITLNSSANRFIYSDQATDGELPEKGETFSALVQSNGEFNNAVLFGASDSDNGYVGYIRVRDNSIELFKRSAGSLTSLNSTTVTLSVDQTYEAVVDWGTDDTITLTVYEFDTAAMERGTEVGVVSATDSEYATNTGYGWGGFGDGGTGDRGLFDFYGVNPTSGGGTVSNLLTTTAQQDTLRNANGHTAIESGGTVYAAVLLADGDGNEDTPVTTDVELRKLDTSTGDVTTNTIETDGTKIDNHFVPSIDLDADGNIHVWYGDLNANGDRSVKHAYSTDDGASWTLNGFAAENHSYIWGKSISNTLYLFTRDDAGGEPMPLDVYQSGDNGASWTSETLIDITDYLVYISGVEVDGSSVHLHLNLRDNTGQPMRYVIHVEYDTSTGDLLSSDGTVLPKPASLSDLQNNNSVIAGSDTTEAAGSNIFLDGSGNPYLAYVADPDADGTFDIYFARWNGTAWDTPIVATNADSSQGWRGGRFVMAVEEATDEFSVYSTIDSFANGTQDLHRWDSTDGGSTWGSQQVERTFTEWINGARNVAPIPNGPTGHRYLAVENVQTGETFPDYVGNAELVSLTDNWEDSG